MNEDLQTCTITEDDVGNVFYLEAIIQPLEDIKRRHEPVDTAVVIVQDSETKQLGFVNIRDDYAFDEKRRGYKTALIHMLNECQYNFYSSQKAAVLAGLRKEKRYYKECLDACVLLEKELIGME